MTSFMSWLFAAIAIAGAGVATIVTDFRRVVLALWVAGLAVGAFYLTLGSEFLAIVQWLVSTLVAIAFLFFSVLFGEELRVSVRGKAEYAPWILASLVGVSFFVLFLLGTLGHDTQIVVAPAGDLASLGKSLTEEHLIAIEVLALMLLTVLIGGGVVARPRAEETDGEEEGGARA